MTGRKLFGSLLSTTAAIAFPVRSEGPGEINALHSDRAIQEPRGHLGLPALPGKRPDDAGGSQVPRKLGGKQLRPLLSTDGVCGHAASGQMGGALEGFGGI